MDTATAFAPILPGQAPLVLFICRYNAGPSQIAEAYLRARLGNRVTVKSAGTMPSSCLDAHVSKVLADDGIPLAGAFPKLVMLSDIHSAFYTVTIGDGIHGVRHTDEHWECADTKHQPLDRIMKVRNALRAQVILLCRRLSAALPHVKKVAG